MKTDLLYVQARRISRAAVERTTALLAKGGVAVFPTDTVYGIAASVFRPQAVRRIYQLKGRSYKKRLPFLVADIDQALALVERPGKRLVKLLEKYWPGPLTVVFNTSSLGQWTTGGKDTLAIRIPDHPVTLAILKKMGQPLAVTSANRSGQPEAVSGHEAQQFFSGRVDILVDAGPCPGGIPSTVINVASTHWTLVREGAIKKKELLRFL
ncbi:MAG: threonylcarbamoyl-AMP synthase [Elusimicrobia bacterium]|nr:threonylcarbamoyl-AMP synthase [Elusimicrobiota bacterium]